MNKYIIKMFGSLSQREKVFIGSGGVVLLAIVLYFAVIAPMADDISLQQRIVTNKQAELKELTLLSQEYASLYKKVNDVERKLAKTDFSMLSYLEEQTKIIGIRDSITYMRPKGEQPTDDYIISSIELMLNSVTLKQAVEVISVIENSPVYTKVKMSHIKTKFSNPDRMDITIKASSYKLKG